MKRPGSRPPAFGRSAAFHIVTGCLPSCLSAVQDSGRVVPEPSQQPPEPRRNGAALAIIGHDLPAMAEAGKSKAVSEFFGMGEWVTSAGRRCRGRKVAIEIEIEGAWEMRAFAETMV